jgi:hypothetical protein
MKHQFNLNLVSQIMKIGIPDKLMVIKILMNNYRPIIMIRRFFIIL